MVGRVLAGTAAVVLVATAWLMGSMMMHRVIGGIRSPDALDEIRRSDAPGWAAGQAFAPLWDTGDREVVGAVAARPRCDLSHRGSARGRPGAAASSRDRRPPCRGSSRVAAGRPPARRPGTPGPVYGRSRTPHARWNSVAYRRRTAFPGPRLGGRRRHDSWDPPAVPPVTRSTGCSVPRLLPPSIERAVGGHGRVDATVREMGSG